MVSFLMIHNFNRDSLLRILEFSANKQELIGLSGDILSLRDDKEKCSFVWECVITVATKRLDRV